MMQLLNLRSLSFSCFPKSKNMTPPPFFLFRHIWNCHHQLWATLLSFLHLFRTSSLPISRMKLIVHPRPLKPQTSLFINCHAVLPAPGISICYAKSARSVVSGSILQSFLIRLAGQFPPPRPQLYLLPPRPSPASTRNSGFRHNSYRHEERYPWPSEV